MYRLTIVSVLVALGLASNAMMQQADKNAFSEIFKHFSEESEFGAQLFLQLQSKVETGAPLSELDDHIAELKSHLEADHEADKKLFTSQEGHLISQISGVEAQLEELEKQQQFLQGKIDVLNEQSQLIDDLFTSDHDAYTERISAQNAMIETIEQLTEKINQHLLEGHSLVQTDDLFEELKQLGRGKHIEVLAQLTAHLDKDQVDKIIFLFADLKKAITESLNADEEKEQENIKLHSSLREELGVLIPQTLQQYQELTVVLEAQQKEYAEDKQEILDLGQTYQDRADTRNFALEKAQEAQKLLNENLDKIARWAQEEGEVEVEEDQ